MIKKTSIAIAGMIYTAFGYSQQLIYQTPGAMALRAIKDTTELRAALDRLGASGNEQDYNTLYTYYQATANRLADSVGKVAISKFPKGSVALNVAAKKLVGTDVVQQDKVMNELRATFPGQQFDKYYSYIIRSFLDNKNAAGAFKYLNLMSEQEKSRALNNVIMMASAFDLKSAAAYLEKELSEKQLSEVNKMNLLLLQSDVLKKTGDYQKAFESINTYYSNTTTRKTPNLQADYYLLMSKTGRYAEALPYLEEAMLKRIGGDELKQELKVAYQKTNPDKDVAAYLANLNSKLKDATRNEIAQSMIQEKAPAFSVLDANGKTVSLSDFKGKTVVIDFWATWCGPCKRALPAMQATVNKYKDDKDVVFLFIHTWEGRSKDADATAAAKKYFADNNYNNLPLYMDLQNASKVNPAVSAFGVKGIPAKFIIDGNGDIRFRKEGAGMDMDYAVAELSAMIDLSKKGFTR